MKTFFVRQGDGYLGRPKAAPFDRSIVTAAPDEVPQPLIEQLAGGATRDSCGGFAFSAFGSDHENEGRD